MRCERCQERMALLRVRRPGGEVRWICQQCAAALEGDRRQVGPDAFLVDDLADGTDGACAACGWTLARFRATNRLGCPACYEAFRRLLMPLLGRLHRHVSHLGKTPRREDGEPGRLAAITRTRAELEKAIAAEDFERAAVLRDRIRGLERNR